MTRLLREPLLHFAILGAVIFGYYAWLRGPEPVGAAQHEIVLGQAELGQLVRQFEATWRRPPTPEELAHIVDGRIREEVLVREALALGMDRDDPVIRNRLRLKMDFLTESAAQAMDPGDDVLRDYLAVNADRYAVPARIAFDQAYLGEAPDAAAIDAARGALAAGADWTEVGARILLQPSVSLATAQGIDGTFGTGFFDVAATLPPGEWSGPVASAYGQHLVRITATEPARAPDFAQVRPVLLSDWQRETKQRLDDAQYQSLAARYDIRRPDAAAIEQALTQ